MTSLKKISRGATDFHDQGLVFFVVVDLIYHINNQEIVKWKKENLIKNTVLSCNLLYSINNRYFHDQGYSNICSSCPYILY